MKVLLFITQYYPIEYGAERAIRDVVEHLIEEYNWTITIITSEIHDIEARRKRENLNYKVLEVFKTETSKNAGFLKSIIFRNRVKGIINKEHPDLKWVVLPFPTLFYIPGNVDVDLVTIQGGDIGDYPGTIAYKFRFLFHRLLRSRLKKAKSISCISDYLKEASKNYFDLPTTIIPNPVARFWFKTTENERFSIKEKEFVTITTTTRLEYVKGIDIIIKALSLVKFDYQFYIAGDGSQKEELIDLTTSLCQENNVNFLGYLEKNEVKRLYDTSDIYVRMPIREGMGISFLEAAASGLPIITSNEMKVHDFLHEIAVFSERDPRLLANRITELLEDQEMMTKMRKNNPEAVRQFSVQNVAKQYYDLLSKQAE